MAFVCVCVCGLVLTILGASPALFKIIQPLTGENDRNPLGTTGTRLIRFKVDWEGKTTENI